MEKQQFLTSREALQSTIKIFFIFSMAVLMLSPMLLGRLGTFKQNDCVQVRTILNSSQVNISSLSYPNSTIIITNQPMTKVGLTFNYTFCNTSVLGIYLYDYYDELGNVYVNDFEITYTGEKPTTQQMTIYLIAFAFLIMLCLSLVFIINKLPTKNATDEEGTIVQVSQLKHLRPLLWTFVWIIGITCLFIISNLGIAYLINPMIGNFFFVLYRIFFYITMVGVPVNFIWIFYKAMKDKELKNLIERGVDVKEYRRF